MSRCELDISDDVKLIAIDESDKKLDGNNALDTQTSYWVYCPVAYSRSDTDCLFI